MYGSWDMELDGQNVLSSWIIFCPFTPLTTWKIKIWKKEKNSWKYYHFTHMYHKWQSYDGRFLRHWVRQTEFFVILDCFLSFYSPCNPKNQNFEKMKKTARDIIILHKCTINDNHMLYSFWDMKCDRQNLLSFWTVFCHFTHRNNMKNQNFKKLKKIPGDIIILQKCIKNHDHMLYCSLDMACNRCNYFSFRAIFCPFLP